MCKTLIAFFAIACANTSVLHAAVLTFNVDLSAAELSVDLSGAGIPTGRVLSITGSITVDPDVAFSSSVATSALRFEIDGDAKFAFAANPAIDDNGQLYWTESDGNLYLNREYGGGGATSVSTMEWRDETLPGLVRTTAGFRSSNGDSTEIHALRIEYLFAPASRISYLAILKIPSGADGPQGFLFGTSATVPEPSSLAILSVGAWGIAGRHRKRAV